ncbi:hypothetical protein P1J78_09700 [Psychromarinibacter sp. C21-152]|uniref:Uncharacterized protein n=1 Tax=Psychromarinibacter sediminicola TaxID=3033385 RepID=A0AAE3NS01_9RHOB|nr:hypothetical protein [Psychromarinibacter sediminicola]MDF0601002.1 hypothetical protein [Psychromarinibacter sediminicola]
MPDHFLEVQSRSAPQYGVGFPAQANLQGADTAVFAAACVEAGAAFFGEGAGNLLAEVPAHLVLFNRETGHSPFVKVFLDTNGHADWMVIFVPVPVGFIDRCAGLDLRVRLAFDGAWRDTFAGAPQSDGQGGRFLFSEAVHYFVMTDARKADG